MKEPKRWILSRPGRERQLILAALAEAPSTAAWERTTARLGQAGVVVGTAGLTMVTAGPAAAKMAAAATSESCLVSAAAGTTVSQGSWFGVAVFVKALLVGFGIGGVALVGANYAQKPAETASQPSAQPIGTGKVVHSLPVASGVASSQDHGTREAAKPPLEREQLRALANASRKAAVRMPSLSREAPLAETSSASETPRAEVVAPTTPALPFERQPSESDAKPRILEREVAAIAKARQALQLGNATTAFRELSSLDAIGGFRVLSQEAALLRVEALAMSGQKAAAAALARQLLSSGVAEAHRRTLLQLATLKK